MAIERMLPPPMGEPTGIEVAFQDEAPADLVETPDGGAEVTIGEAPAVAPPVSSFYSNIVDLIPEADKVASDLRSFYDADERSREEWKKTLEDGLKLLGINIEERTEPWEGACGVFHPLMTEAAIRFQSQAITEIFPAAGPVRTVIMEEETPDLIAQAKRVAKEMNYQLTEKMPEYRAEMEALLFRTPIVGSCFKKVYFDPIRKRARAMMVPAEDLCVNYAATSLLDAGRITHIHRVPAAEMKKMAALGVYSKALDPDLSVEADDLQDAEDDITGTEAVAEAADTVTVLEMHVDVYLSSDPLGADPNEIPKPYIFTIAKDTDEVIAIRRNWEEGDTAWEARQHFVHYKYLPGLGFYGIGLIQLIGGLTQGATSVLRQLVDAGTLANIPAGFKTKGLRWKNEDEPLRPGEFRDVDATSDDIAKNIMPIPFKEPSGTLFELMRNMVEEGRRLGSIAEVDMSNMNSEAPVGTILAILERNLKVQTAVHSRLHASLRDELRMIESIIAKDMPPAYDYKVKGGFTRQQDFDQSIVILPVSDPNAATMSQRLVQHQAVLQNAQMAPELYDMPRLHRMGLEILDWPDPEKMIPLDEERQLQDPVTENMNVIMGKPVKAFMEQDHESHIRVHMAAMNDPKIQMVMGQNPQAPQMMAAMSAHIAEHVAYKYRQEIEKQMGTQLPPPDMPLPPEIEAQLSYLAAQAADRLLQKDVAEMEAQQRAKEAQDPLVALQKEELAVKREAIQSKERIEGAKLGVKLATDDRAQDRSDKTEGVKLGVDIADAIQQQKINMVKALNPPPVKEKGPPGE